MWIYKINAPITTEDRVITRQQSSNPGKQDLGSNRSRPDKGHRLGVGLGSVEYLNVVMWGDFL